MSILLHRINFIKSERQEFTEHLNDVIAIARDNQYPAYMHALYHLSLIYLELRKFGIEVITKAHFEEVVSMLRKFPESAPQINKIQQQIERQNRSTTVAA